MERHIENTKMAKFDVPSIKEWDFMMVWILKKKKKICMEIVAGKQSLAHQQLFPYKSS